jgi:hypothetical protein
LGSGNDFRCWMCPREGTFVGQLREVCGIVFTAGEGAPDPNPRMIPGLRSAGLSLGPRGGARSPAGESGRCELC